MYLSEHVSKKAKFNKAVVSHKKIYVLALLTPPHSLHYRLNTFKKTKGGGEN